MKIFKLLTFGLWSFAALVTLPSKLQAQDHENFNDDTRLIIGGGVVVPFGKYADQLNDIGGGLDLRLEIPFANKALALTGTAGFDYFGGQRAGNNYIGYSSNLYMGYLKAGLKFYARRSFYFQGDAGGNSTYISRSSYFFPDGQNSGTVTSSNKKYTEGGLIYSLGFGTIIPTGKVGIDISVKYNGVQLGTGSENYLHYGSLRLGIPLF